MTFSPPKRNSGRPCFQVVSPVLRKLTATVALRLSSPAIRHSKPRQIRVGRSTRNLPGVTALAAERMAWGRKRRSAKSRMGGGMRAAYHRAGVGVLKRAFKILLATGLRAAAFHCLRQPYAVRLV